MFYAGVWLPGALGITIEAISRAKVISLKMRP